MTSCSSTVGSVSSANTVIKSGSRCVADTLSAYPQAMFQQGFILQKAVYVIVVFGQRHFIKERVYAAMTLAANINAGSQLLTVISFLKKAPSMHFFGN